MATTPHTADKKAAAWVHTAAPDDDYLPEPDRGSSDREVLAGGDPEIPELAEWTASLNPEARRSNSGRAKRAPMKSKAVKLRDGRVGKIPTTLTIGEFNEKYNVAPAAAPIEAPVIDSTPAPPTPEDRASLSRRGAWNGPPIEVNGPDSNGDGEWSGDRWDRIYGRWDRFADVAEMDRNYDEPDEYDEYNGPDGDDIPNWYDVTAQEIAVHDAARREERRREWWDQDHSPVEYFPSMSPWEPSVRHDVGETAAQRAAREREMARRRLWDLRQDLGLANQNRAADIEARMLADQWRAEAQPETCGNPNGCDGPIKAKGRCSPCHEWRRTHHGDERPAAKVNRVRRRKGN